MKPSELMWNIFAITGNVDAYLLYLDCISDERSQDCHNVRGVLDMP